MKNLCVLILTALFSVSAVSCGTSMLRPALTLDKAGVIPFCLSPELTSLPYDSLRSDPFHIESLSVIDNYLQVVFSYGGGCGDIKSNVYYNQLVKQSFPPQLDLKMTLLDNDPCRAIVTDTLNICLNEFESMARGGGVVIGLAPSDIKLRYSLPLN
ncbi:MAG: hypothetical protein Q8S18_15055 [Bacteroidales bacterium]|nr:hypothetical protein [Bacteroidales bacterium]